MTQLPAYLMNRPDFGGFAPEDYTSGIGSALPPHLSISDNRFTLVDAAGNERQLPTLFIDVVIVGVNKNKSRLYYDPTRPYRPGDNQPPLCFSDNGVGPSRNAQQPQSPTCAVCPHSAWNSAISRVTGKGIPACQESKKLAILWAGDTDEMAYMFKVPPASLGNLSTYVKSLAGSMLGGRPANPADVITRVEFESQGVVKFTPISIITEDIFNRQNRLWANPQAVSQLVGRDDIPIDAAAGLPGAAQPRALPATQPTQFAPPNAQTTVPVQFQPAPTQFQQAPQQPAPEAPKRARGRPKAQEAAPQAPTQAPFMQPAQNAAPAPVAAPAVQPAATGSGDGLDIPAFLQRTPANTPAPQAQFGMVEAAPAPPNDVQAALDAAFKLPGV